MSIRQGDIYWVALDTPSDEEPGIIHPHVVLQEDVLNQSRIETVVVCALTTNAKKRKWPGNVLLEMGEANLPKPSIVVVSQVSTVSKAQLGAYIGTLSAERVQEIFAGMRFLQTITQRPDYE